MIPSHAAGGLDGSVHTHRCDQVVISDGYCVSYRIWHMVQVMYRMFPVYGSPVRDQTSSMTIPNAKLYMYCTNSHGEARAWYDRLLRSTAYPQQDPGFRTKALQLPSCQCGTHRHAAGTTCSGCQEAQSPAPLPWLSQRQGACRGVRAPRSAGLGATSDCARALDAEVWRAAVERHVAVLLQGSSLLPLHVLKTSETAS
jgi:hypothetical protein